MQKTIKSGTEGADRKATSPFMSVSRGLRTQDSAAASNPQLPFSSPETRRDTHAGQLASWTPCSQASCVDDIFPLSSWRMQVSRREGESFSAGQSASALICTGVESQPSPVQSSPNGATARHGEAKLQRRGNP